MLLLLLKYAAARSELRLTALPRCRLRNGVPLSYQLRSNATWNPGATGAFYSVPTIEETQPDVEDVAFSDRSIGEFQNVDVQDTDAEAKAKAKVATRARLESYHQESPTMEAPPTEVQSLDTSLNRGSMTIKEAQRAVLDALQQEASGKLLYAFLSASKDPDYIRDLPTTTFLEILHLLHPKHILNPYKALYRDFRLSESSRFEDEMNPVQDIFEEYSDAIRTLMRRRQHAGHSLGLDECRLLLGMTAAVGNGEAAQVVWNDMAAGRIEPDTICYNLYFESKCWSNAYDPVEKEKLRVIPYHYASRLPVKQGMQRRKGFTGHTTGKTGLKNEIIKNFDSMVKKGVTANVDTYIMLIIAMGRDGDLAGVKSILERVWDIQVDAILEQDDRPNAGHKMSPASPTYPNDELLFAIAHIFGTNNDIPDALRLIDFVSRKYSIKISMKTWAQLLEWTFVLSSRRYKSRKHDGAQLGQLPLQSVESLWNTMISEPYNIKPTIPMYNRYVRTSWKRQMLNSMLDKMRAGVQLHLRFKERQKIATNSREKSAISTREKIAITAGAHSATGAQSEYARRKREIEYLEQCRDFFIISRWFRLLLAGRKWAVGSSWERSGVPNAIAEFWIYRPREGIEYSTSVGRVELSLQPSSMFVNVCPSTLEGISAITDAFPVAESTALSAIEDILGSE
ncbi:hypothetical protein MMC06_002765 [Schaereria dolodes]|nr:hypothetical protein [Schaereria dolodes]